MESRKERIPTDEERAAKGKQVTKYFEELQRRLDDGLETNPPYDEGHLRLIDISDQAKVRREASS